MASFSLPSLVTVTSDSTNFTTTPPTISDGSGINRPGQYIVQEVQLFLNNNVPVDMRPILDELEIQEDLFSFAASGHLYISDAIGLIEKLNINGFNFIKITFGKSSVNDPNKFTRLFRVFKIGKRHQISRSVEQYAIQFCSEEVFLSEQTRIARSLSNMNISSMILSVVDNYLETSEGKINTIESTKGQYNFIVPNLKPFEAISWLSTYAQPEDVRFPGADMLFYENRQGYNFRSLQSMMNDVVYNTYNYNPQNLTRTNINVDVSSILSFKFTKMFDTLEAVSSGAFANKVVALDPLMRRVDVRTFNYDEYFNRSQHLNTNKLTSGYVNRYNKKDSEMYDSVYKVVSTNADQRSLEAIKAKDTNIRAVAPPIGVEVYVPNRTAQLALINYTKIMFEVPGDPGLAVGNVVKLNIPSFGPKSDASKSVDGFHSGKYLVSAVTHRMNTEGLYTCIVEAIKDSVSYPYSDGSGNSVGASNLNKA